MIICLTQKISEALFHHSSSFWCPVFMLSFLISVWHCFHFIFWMKTSLDAHEFISAPPLVSKWTKIRNKTKRNYPNKKPKNHYLILLFFHYLTRFKLCACNYFAFVCLTVSFAQSKLEFALFFFCFQFSVVRLVCMQVYVNVGKKICFSGLACGNMENGLCFSFCMCILFWFFLRSYVYTIMFNFPPGMRINIKRHLIG